MAERRMPPPLIPEAWARDFIDYVTRPRPEWLDRAMKKAEREMRAKRVRMFVRRVRALQSWKAAYDG